MVAKEYARMSTLNYCRYLFQGLTCAVGLTFASSVTMLSYAAAAQQALKQEGSDAFYQRVLSLPKAVLYQQPDLQSPKVVEEVPAFSVFYIYGQKEIDQEFWIDVGPKPEDGGDGWIRKKDTEAWESMLVMQYAPRGQRGRVPFFDDVAALRGVVEDYNQAFDPVALVDQGKALDASIVAIEPDGAILANEKPYLMPIFEFEFAEFGNDTLEPTTLISVGGLNMDENAPAPGQMAGGGAGAPGGNGPPPAPSLEEFKIGIAFAIDTTHSLGPYIEKTRNIVRDIYGRLEADGTLDKALFAVVGYRDDVAYNSEIGYVTKIFQNFDPAAPPQTVLSNMEQVKPATVSTADWNEDAWAGALAAISQLSWEENNISARLLIMISDAGARGEGDPRASINNGSATYVAEAARQKGIAILPIHLRTPEAERAGNLGSAERQFRGIGGTGDEGVNKYVGVDAGDVADFARRLTDAAKQVAIAVRQSTGNQRMAQPRVDNNAPPPQSESPSDKQASDAPPQTDLGQYLVNEVFRAQLEYIGRRGEAQSPRFYRAWAADRDVRHPQLDALDPSVFLTRNQVNGLAKSLNDIVVRAKAADVDPGSFFDLLQSLAATTSLDPTMSGQAGEFSNLAESGLLPSFLEELPYHSDVLLLNRQQWQDMGLTGREEFIGGLEQKLAVYQLINESTDRWLDLGAGDPALDVYPVPLIYLP